MDKKNPDVVVDFADEKMWLDDEASGELTPYAASGAVRQAVNDLGQNIREVLSIPASEWTRGKSVVLSLEFQVVPKKIEVRVEETE